jgi:hypothetical protein
MNLERQAVGGMQRSAQLKPKRRRKRRRGKACARCPQVDYSLVLEALPADPAHAACSWSFIYFTRKGGKFADIFVPARAGRDGVYPEGVMVAASLEVMKTVSAPGNAGHGCPSGAIVLSQSA